MADLLLAAGVALFGLAGGLALWAWRGLALWARRDGEVTP